MYVRRYIGSLCIMFQVISDDMPTHPNMSKCQCLINITAFYDVIYLHDFRLVLI